jgi:lysozyme
MIHEKGIEIIKHYESLHDGDLSKIGLQPKACPTGYWSIGYGHVIIDPLTNKMLRGGAAKMRAYELHPSISEDEAHQLLIDDIARYEASVRNFIRRTLNEEQVAACTSLCYNIGIGNFNRPCGVLRNINAGKYAQAGDSFMSWIKGNVDADPELEILPGLVARRKSERDLFLYGVLNIYN